MYHVVSTASTQLISSNHQLARDLGFTVCKHLLVVRRQGRTAQAISDMFDWMSGVFHHADNLHGALLDPSHTCRGPCIPGCSLHLLFLL